MAFHNLLTSSTSITPSVILQQSTDSSSLRLSCWKGDITTLTDITAIVNAANAQLEGCFRPKHRCIDNVIHAAVGPRLRDACHSLIEDQGHIEPVGSAKVTPGFRLPASWVLHTVGPQLHRSCFLLHINGTIRLPIRNCRRNCRGYSCILPSSQPSQSLQISSQIPNAAVTKARTWINEASNLIISAGAGLSAATGLDYTSTALFDKHFHAFTAKGLRRLYDVFGHVDWDIPGHKWGYYFLHLNMVRSWPTSPVYSNLRELVGQFPSKYFIRTSNADGFFLKNGFDPEFISTPQGQYGFLQCFNKCRPDAVFPSDPLVDAALPFIDPVTRVLTDSTKIPHCPFCGGEATICVRGGHYFNAGPFRAQNMKWDRFLKGLDRHQLGESDGSATTVILELGVGLNTPGVLRCPNENLVIGSESQGFRLIRVGMGLQGVFLGSWRSKT
ncbi:unnamed protein product [Penicillium viridicatum]